MPTLTRDSLDLKLLQERNRVEAKRGEPLEGIPDSQRWLARCTFADCDWQIAGLLSEAAADTAAHLHLNATGHQSELRCSMEFKCRIVRGVR